jgi:hypothetical protein
MGIQLFRDDWPADRVWFSHIVRYDAGLITTLLQTGFDCFAEWLPLSNKFLI